jgi:hypothetical protein
MLSRCTTTLDHSKFSIAIIIQQSLNLFTLVESRTNTHEDYFLTCLLTRVIFLGRLLLGGTYFENTSLVGNFLFLDGGNIGFGWDTLF